MLNRLSTLLLILILAFLSYGAIFIHFEKIKGYDLTKPDTRLILPDTLREVSGLASINATTFACVQDENGILFIYDAVKNEIKKQYTFNIDGDYEGITRVDRTIYILRSDGTLFEISNYQSKNFKLKSYETGMPAPNNEGLCYDQDNNRLLIASKGKMGKGPELKDKRVIFGFDLKTKTLSKEPVFNFDVQTIKQFALDHNIILKLKTKKNETIAKPSLKLATSAICIHPLTGKLYLLSASDYLLFVFDFKGKIEYIEELDQVLFNKAEGISFFENGDMLITNEAQGKQPTLLRFNYKVK